MEGKECGETPSLVLARRACGNQEKGRYPGPTPEQKVVTAAGTEENPKLCPPTGQKDQSLPKVLAEQESSPFWTYIHVSHVLLLWPQWLPSAEFYKVTEEEGLGNRWRLIKQGVNGTSLGDHQAMELPWFLVQPQRSRQGGPKHRS